MSGLRENWSELYGASLTNEDVKGIGETLYSFFSLLKMWNDKEEVVENENKGNGD